jgi:hypothetical protein
MKGAGEAWQRFFFTPSRPLDLGASRLVFYGIVLVLYGAYDFAAWSDVSPVFRRPLWMYVWSGIPFPPHAVTVVLQWTWRVALILSCVGLHTRSATAVSFVLGGYLLCLPQNFGKIHHFDAPVVLVMGILAASRSGDALSVDRWRACRKAIPAPDPSPEYTWPVRAAWMVLALVLFGAGVSKVRHGGLAWLHPDNLAIRFISHQYHIANADPLTSWGLRVARVPWLCSLLAGLTIVFECGFPLVLVSQWARRLLVPGTLVMLVGIRLLLGPSFESYLALYAFFVPWNRVLDRDPRPA